MDTVPDPEIQDPADVIIRVTTTGLCGSDLHLYEVLGPFLDAGDILGPEPMGIVEEVGSEVVNVRKGDRVLVPFNISCGTRFMCKQGLHSQCETTQVHSQGSGASLFGYTKLYGQVPGGQAEYLRVPFGNTLPIAVPPGPPDERFVYLSDVLPTAWQAVDYAAVPPGGTVVVLGLGPIGDMCTRIAAHRGAKTVIGIDLVPERLDRVKAHGVHTLSLEEQGDGIVAAVRDLTDGRGPRRRHRRRRNGGSRRRRPSRPADDDPVAQQAGCQVDATRRRGPPVCAVPGHRARPPRRHDLPVRCLRRDGRPPASLTMFDKQIQLRMGQANVWRWVDDLLPLLTDADPLGVESFATHRMPLEEAPDAYEMFQKKQDGAVKILFNP